MSCLSCCFRGAASPPPPPPQRASLAETPVDRVPSTPTSSTPLMIDAPRSRAGSGSLNSQSSAKGSPLLSGLRRFRRTGSGGSASSDSGCGSASGSQVSLSLPDRGNWKEEEVNLVTLERLRLLAQSYPFSAIHSKESVYTLKVGGWEAQKIQATKNASRYLKLNFPKSPDTDISRVYAKSIISVHAKTFCRVHDWDSDEVTGLALTILGPNAERNKDGSETKQQPQFKLTKAYTVPRKVKSDSSPLSGKARASRGPQHDPLILEFVYDQDNPYRLPKDEHQGYLGSAVLLGPSFLVENKV